METNDVKELAVLLDLSQTEKDLIAAEARHTDVVYDVKLPAQMKLAKAARSELKSMRTTAEGKRLEAGRVLLGMKKKNDEFAQGLIARIRAMEDPIDATIKAEESRVEAELAAKALAEQARQQAHRDAIERFRAFPMSLQGKPSAVIESRIADFAVPGGDGWDVFEEFEAEARDAYKAALASAKELHARAVEQEEKDRLFEEQQATLREQQEKLEKLEREAKARQEEDERRERQKAERIEMAIWHISARGRGLEMLSFAELQQLAAYHDSQNPGGEPERFGNRLQDALKAHADVCEVITEAMEKTQLREDREREEEQQRARDLVNLEEQRKQQEAEAQQQREAKAELDRQQREHAEQVEAQRIANLGLMEAVKAVVDDFREDYPIPESIQDLIKVYDALPVEKRTASKPVKRLHS